MLLETILPPRGDHDFFATRRLQLVAVSEASLGLGATVEDVVFNLIPGVAARSVLLPRTAAYRDLYARAVGEVAARVKAAGGVVRRASPLLATVEYTHRATTGGMVPDAVHVRLLHTDVAFMQIAGEAGEHAGDPPVDFRQMRTELIEIIRTDLELSDADRRALLTRARHPICPISTLTTAYARIKKDRALAQLAAVHAPGCARAAYAALRELTRSVLREVYALPAWSELSAAEQHDLVVLTTKVICGETTPFLHGAAYGPLFLGVVQQTLMHHVGAAAGHERERAYVAELLRRVDEPVGAA